MWSGSLSHISSLRVRARPTSPYHYKNLLWKRHPSEDWIDGVWPLLEEAIKRGKIDVIRRLCRDYGTELITKPAPCVCTGVTALHLACYTDSATLTALLGQPDVNVNVEDAAGDTSLHHCAANCRGETLLPLLRDGRARLNKKNKKGMTVLHYASKFKCSRNVRELIDFIKRTIWSPENLDINSKDNAGYTALHYAVENQDLETVMALLEAPYIDKHAVANNGATPKRIAETTKNLAIQDLLEPNYKAPGIPRAFVINNWKFVVGEDREGSKEECKHIISRLQQCGISVTEKENLSAKHMYQTLIEFKDLCCSRPTSYIILVVMTHGYQAILKGVDNKDIPLNWILRLFTGENDSRLANIPKVGIIQACRSTLVVPRQPQTPEVQSKADYGDYVHQYDWENFPPILDLDRQKVMLPGPHFLVIHATLDNQPARRGLLIRAIADRLVDCQDLEWSAMARQVRDNLCNSSQTPVLEDTLLKHLFIGPIN